MKLERLLFASIQGYLDPSNGAATARRDLLELLSARGVDCRVLSTGVLGYREETPLETGGVKGDVAILGRRMERLGNPLGAISCSCGDRMGAESGTGSVLGAWVI